MDPRQQNGVCLGTTAASGLSAISNGVEADGAEIQDPGRNASRRQRHEMNGREAGGIVTGEDDNK